jgi:hypothetical protein
LGGVVSRTGTLPVGGAAWPDAGQVASELTANELPNKSSATTRPCAFLLTAGSLHINSGYSPNDTRSFTPAMNCNIFASAHGPIWQGTRRGFSRQKTGSARPRAARARGQLPPCARALSAIAARQRASMSLAPVGADSRSANQLRVICRCRLRRKLLTVARSGGHSRPKRHTLTSELTSHCCFIGCAK